MSGNAMTHRLLILAAVALAAPAAAQPGAGGGGGWEALTPPGRNDARHCAYFVEVEPVQQLPTPGGALNFATRLTNRLSQPVTLVVTLRTVPAGFTPAEAVLARQSVSIPGGASRGFLLGTAPVGRVTPNDVQAVIGLSCSG